jgi:hypothetical protein
MYREGPFPKPSSTLCPGSRSQLGIVRHRSPQSFSERHLRQGGPGLAFETWGLCLHLRRTLPHLRHLADASYRHRKKCRIRRQILELQLDPIRCHHGYIIERVSGHRPPSVHSLQLGCGSDLFHWSCGGARGPDGGWPRSTQINFDCQVFSFAYCSADNSSHTPPRPVSMP